MVAIVETTKRVPPGKASRGTLAELVAKQKLLSEQRGEFSSVQPIQSWTQGLAQVTGALTTGMQQHAAETAESEGRAKLAQLQAMVKDEGASPQQLAEMGLIDPDVAETYRQEAAAARAAKRIADAAVADREDRQVQELGVLGKTQEFTTSERKGGETFTGGQNQEERDLKIELQDNEIRANQEQAELEHKLKMLEPGSPGAKVIHDYQNGVYGPLGSVAAIKARDADFNNATGILQAETSKDIATAHDAVSERIATSGNTSAESIAAGNNQTSLTVGREGNASSEKIATGNNQTSLTVGREGNASSEKIATGNNQTTLTAEQMGNTSAEGIANRNIAAQRDAATVLNQRSPESEVGKNQQDYMDGVYGPVGSPDAVRLLNEANKKATAIKGPDTVMMNGGGDLRKEFYKTTGEKTLPAYMAEAQKAGALTRDMELLEAIDPTVQGPLTGRLAQLFPGFSDQAAVFESIVKRAAPGLREPGSGSTSDIEYQGMLDSLPQLRNNPEANAMIREAIKAQAQISIARGKIINEWQRSAGNPEAENILFDKLSALDAQSIMNPKLAAMIEAAKNPAGLTPAANAAVDPNNAGGADPFADYDPVDRAVIDRYRTRPTVTP